MDLVAQLKSFIGWRIGVQFWNSVMTYMDEEGPYPLHGDCHDVLIRQEGEFLQAYLVVDNLQEQPTRDGHTPMGYLTPIEESSRQLAPLAELYAVWALAPIAAVPVAPSLTAVPKARKSRKKAATPTLAGGPVISVAWPAFAQRLADVLAALQEDQYLILSVKRSHRFIQFAACG